MLHRIIIILFRKYPPRCAATYLVTYVNISMRCLTIKVDENRRFPRLVINSPSNALTLAKSVHYQNKMNTINGRMRGTKTVNYETRTMTIRWWRHSI